MKLFNLNLKDRMHVDESLLTERTRLFTGYACNIKCKFCFYNGLKDKDRNFVKRSIMKQINLCKKYGIKDLDISGGEPTVLPDWFELLSTLKKSGFRKITVITNGYKLADPEFFRKSVDKGLNEILFSLHGPNAEVHDKMTGVKGSFHKIIEAISNANKGMIPIRINTVVAKDNYEELPKISYLVNSIKPIAFNFLPFRIENEAPKENTLRYCEVIPYIRETIKNIDKAFDKPKISIRYVPFCVVKGLEKYNCNYIQRMCDPDEWSEYLIRKFENARFNKEINDIEIDNKLELEKIAIYKTLKTKCGYSTGCLKCRNLYICDGIWKSYAKVWGTKEFKPIEGEKIKDVLYY